MSKAKPYTLEDLEAPLTPRSVHQFLGDHGAARLQATIEAYEDLLDAVKVSHETGFWGPVEDAYAASGRPCLKHREKT